MISVTSFFRIMKLSSTKASVLYPLLVISSISFLMFSADRNEHSGI